MPNQKIGIIVTNPVTKQIQSEILPSSCIGLIFMSQSNLIADSSVHSSLDPNCHYQILFAKLNLHIVYPPLIYERLALLTRI